MIRKTSAALALLLTVACASNPLTSAGTSGGSTAASLPNVKNAPEYVLLSAPNQVRSYDFGNAIGVKGLHVRGVMTNRGFAAVGEIQGNGKFCTSGQDWLSLADMTVYKASDGKTRKAPYIDGCAVGSAFQPASRTIVTE